MNELSPIAFIAADQSSPSIEITAFTKDDGPLTKQISLTGDGKLGSNSSACLMQSGTTRRERFNGFSDFADYIHDLTSAQATAFGALKPARNDLNVHSQLSQSTDGAHLLDQVADYELSLGHLAHAECLAHQAAGLWQAVVL